MKSDQASPFCIRLFGPFEVLVHGRPIPHLKFRKSQTLLALLALRQESPAPRDAVAALLWPESQGTQSLRNSLTELRRALGCEAGRLRSPTSRTVGLDLTGAFVDVLAFDAALARGDPAALEEAVSLYQGPLLEGCLEEWALQERQLREQAYLTAREILAALAVARGEPAAAERHLRLAVAADPLRESAHRALMELLAAGGNYAAALLVYRELRVRLHHELNAAPDSETQALLQRLRGEARGKAVAGHQAPTTMLPTRAPAVPDPRRALQGNARVTDAFSPNLPLQLTRLFGRQAEIAQLSAALSPPFPAADSDLCADGAGMSAGGPRLLTLTGPGGSGKTRLALEAAYALRAAFAGALCYVALADLTDPGLIPERIRDGLMLPRAPQVEPLEQVAAFLSRQPFLLILDNFEHLLAARAASEEPGTKDGAAQVWGLLQRVRHLLVLVTSRQRLGLPGEREYPVAPLPVPGVQVTAELPPEHHDPLRAHPTRTPEHLTQFPSVALFVDRAQAMRPDFQITEENAAAVAGLCRRLDGLPLALELAAARSSVLTPEQMLARLEAIHPAHGYPSAGAGQSRLDAQRVPPAGRVMGRGPGPGRFELLVTREKMPDPRHRSLRAALDWSVQLLSPELRQFFARLSIFRGGCDLSAVEAICSVSAGASPGTTSRDSLRQGSALENLEELRACSLVLVEERRVSPPVAGVPLRFCLLESLREYGAELLQEEGREELQQRHAAYFVAFAEEADRNLRGPGLEEWTARLEAERDNFRAAFCWAADHREHETALRLAGALIWFWWLHNYYPEGQHWLETSLRLSGTAAPPALRAQALRGVGQLAWAQNDFHHARAALHESIGIWREIGDKVGLAHALSILGWVEQDAGRYPVSRAAREECLILFRDADDPWGIAWATHCLGRSACEEGDAETARRLHEEAAVLFRAQGDPFGRCLPPMGLAHAALTEGDYAAAARHLEEGLAISRRFFGRSEATGNFLAHLGTTLASLGEWQGAAARQEEAVELRRLAGNPWAVAEALHFLGIATQRADQPERAAAALTESLQLYRNAGDRNGEALALISHSRLARRQRCLGEARSYLQQALAAARTAQNQRVLAAAIEETAALLADRNQPGGWEHAAQLLGAAEAIRRAATAPLPSWDRTVSEHQLAAVRSALGDATFETAWARGQTRPVEALIAEALQEAATD